MSSTLGKFKIALVQLKVGADKGANLASARKLVIEAGAKGAKLVVLPECFNSPYGTQYFSKYAEEMSESGDKKSETVQALSEMAAKAGVYLVGGSIPEREAESGKLYNTSTVYDSSGTMVAKHRKVHLFDIDVPGKIRFIESEVLSAGDRGTVFDTPWGRIGLGICYDLRFPELAMIAARREGIKAMIYPGAFNMTTGPLHWELLLRARAVDNMIYVAGCGPARDLEASYHAWGHSTLVGPDGQVVAGSGFEETIVYGDMETSAIDGIREAIPIYKQRRFDVYPDVADEDSKYTKLQASKQFDDIADYTLKFGTINSKDSSISLVNSVLTKQVKVNKVF
ncbi:hypothetical protein BB561_003713 [Smittium simulii]|uniref:CN hydrolase domain-containing protein n=1 Tax=Smittium simulii TaxID=133385 RepID=A0A2T9YJX6_9FUNG|nr:hypothetical protein BB561_003713 [Smittium simulii]